MPNYNDISGQQMPSLAEMVARMRAKRAANAARNPGERPNDRIGRQQQVSIEGEAPIQAQQVRPGAQGGVGVEIGPVSQVQEQPMRLPGITVPIGGQRAPQMSQPVAQGQDPRNAMLQKLMAENKSRGMTQQQAFEDAFRRVAAGG